MYTCAKCNIYSPRITRSSGKREKMPKNCPMQEREKMNNAFENIHWKKNHEFYVKCSED